MVAQRLRVERFPHLAAAGYDISSPPTEGYNCFAWAASESDRWWSPDAFAGYYWPDSVPSEPTFDAHVAAFRSVGYEACDTDDLEVGYEKIALYASRDGDPKHAARQLPNGRWTSKMGKSEDIEHVNLACLEGDVYGTVRQMMKRKRLPDATDTTAG
jgi:hypothetical protein